MIRDYPPHRGTCHTLFNDPGKNSPAFCLCRAQRAKRFAKSFRCHDERRRIQCVRSSWTTKLGILVEKFLHRSKWRTKFAPTGMGDARCSTYIVPLRTTEPAAASSTLDSTRIFQKLEAAVVALLFWVTARVFYSPEPTVYLVVDMVAHVTGHATLILWLMLWNGTEPPMTIKKRTNTGQSNSSSSGSNGLAWHGGASMTRRPSG
jgi:hypothetical protein